MTSLCEPCEGSSSEAGVSDSNADLQPTASKNASPSVSELILWAVATSPNCQGLSLETLKKIVTKAGYDVMRNKTHFLRVLKGLVSKGLLKQMTGPDDSGSFHSGKRSKERKNKVTAKKKKKSGSRKTSMQAPSRSSKPAQRGRKRKATA